MASPRTTREELDRALSFVLRSLSYWKRTFVVFVVGSLIGIPFVFMAPRTYRSETVILYQETIRSQDITGTEGGGDSAARRVGARLREVLLSRTSLEPIITSLRLYGYGQDPSPRVLLDSVEEMRKHVSFKAREGDAFDIAFEGRTPEEAKEVTRRLGECIIQEASSRRTEQAKTLKEFLTAESDRNNAELRTAEAALAKFTALHPALAARLTLLPGQQLSPAAAAAQPGGTAATGDPAMAALEWRAVRIERQLAKVGSATPPAPTPKPVPFEPLPDSADLIAARRDLAEKLARYTDKHPDVNASRGRLRVAEAAQAAANAAAAQAHAAAQASAATTEEPPPQNAADEAALRKELAGLRGQIAARRAALPADTRTADTRTPTAAGSATGAVVDEPSSAVALELEFRRLQRDVNEGRDRQNQLDAKLFHASINASSVMSDRNIQVSVLDPAYLPHRPISKPRWFMLGISCLVSLLLGILAALVSTKLDDRIYDRVDIERLDLQIVGVIPRALPPGR